MAQDRDLLKALVKEAFDQILKAEMTEFLGVASGERNPARAGYRAGYYERGLITRVGKIEWRVPRDRSGEFSTALFERFQRSEKALVLALVEMYVQSTWKVNAISAKLCRHSFAASAICAINKVLDEGLTKLFFRPKAVCAPCPLWAVRARLSDRLLLQGTRGVPVMQQPAQGGDRGASDRSRLPGSASAAVGAVGAQAAALLPATYAAAHDAALRMFLRVVEKGLRARGPGSGPAARIGAVAFIHRFGSTLNAHLPLPLRGH